MSRSESRVQNAIRNLKVAWVCQLIMILFKFVTRRLFTQAIPNEYLGLDNLFTNIIGLLNLAELGLGTAIGYALYKPLAARDELRVASVMHYMSTVFKKIAGVILFIGILVSPLLHIFSPEIVRLKYAYLAYFCYLISTVSGYLFGYKSVLCSADQQNYIYTKNHYAFALSMNLVQALVLYYTSSYIIYVGVQLIFTVLEGIGLSWVMDRNYPVLRMDVTNQIEAAVKNKIWTDVKSISIGKVGMQIIASTDTIVITRILNLSVSAIYGNYVLIFAAVSTIVEQVLYAMNGSVGNLVATEPKDKQMEVFWQLQFLQISMYSCAAVCIYNLIQPFIAYWLGAQYWLDNRVLIALIVSFYFKGSRTVVNTFRNAYGLFSIEARKALVEALINVITSIALAKTIGILGVVLGTILSQICWGMWVEIRDLNRSLGIGVLKYIKKMIEWSVVAMGAMVISSVFCSSMPMHWFIRLPLALVTSLLVFVICWILCFGRMYEFRLAVMQLKKVICKFGG